jgi:hypothetical protein
MRLDEDKLDTLRRWGHGLEEAGGEESAAAGRAILMLIAEIEQLQIDLRVVRGQLSRQGPPSSDAVAENSEEPFGSTLRERLKRVVGRESDSVPRTRTEPGEETRSGMESNGATTSPQAWIDALRRHE